MARIPTLAALQARRALSPGVEWEFRHVSYGRELSRSAVTRLLVEQAEIGGWELARTRISPDGQRSVVLRRRIIRQQRPDQNGLSALR